MSDDKSGYNAPKDVRKTQRDRRDDVFEKSDAEKCDVKKQGDRERGAVKSPRNKDVREHSVRNDSFYSSRQRQWKSSKGRGTSESRLVPRMKGEIWEPGPSGHGRSSGASRRHSCGSSYMQTQVSEVDINPSHGMVRRADTHTGGVLHVNLAASQPKRTISEGGSGRRVVEKREEDGEDDDLRRLSDLEERLSGSLARWNGRAARFGRVQDICFQLQAETRHFLQAQGLLAFLKKDLCGRLWRAGYYPVVEGLRKALSQAASSEDREALQDTYLRFLSMASSFYQEEMSGLQRRLEFTLPELLDPTRKHSSQVLRAKILCHQFYLALGDLARYAEQASERPDWSKAKNYYITAQELMPKYGKTYNQLAVVAISAQRRLDAVYYYIRSLSAGNPFLGARESLLGLLHDTGSKVEPPKKKQGGRLGGVASPLRQDAKKKVDSTKKHGGQKETREVWVFPTRTLEDVKKMMLAEDLPQEMERKLGVEETSQRSNFLPELVDAAPPSELSKNIVKLFLAVHAKMYTKIGYDTLGQAVTSFLSSWAKFLSHRLTHSDAVLCIKMAVINFFSVHNASGDGYCQGRLHLMGVALCFVLKVTAVAVRCCLSRLAGAASPLSRSTVPWEEANSLEGLSAEAKASLLEVGHLLVPVKVSFDWLACQSSLWGECASQVDPSVWLQFWSHSADLLNRLRTLLPHTTLTQDATTLTQVALYEDRHLQGFSPIANALGTVAYTIRSPTEEESLLQYLKRVSCLLTRAQELTDRACTPGVRHYLEFSTTEQRFNCSSKEDEDNEEKEEGEEEAEGEEEDKKKARASSSEEEKEEKEEEGEEEEEEGEVEEEEEKEEEEEEEEKEEEEEGEAGGSEGGTPSSTPPSSPVDGNLDLLRAEREELAKEMWEKEKAKERVKDYLAGQAVEGRGKVFVFPKYLIPDTNEFIDHLPQLVQLVACGHFVLTVPLTVIEELEGIAKGSSVAAQGKHEHSSSATQGAKEALSLLRGWFSSKSPSVRAITVRGELLTAMDYATMERMGGTVTTNDDFILASCSSVNARTSKASTHNTNVMCVVVLLTADRNLRVKAHAAGIPVRDFPSFMAWVKPALKLKEIK